MCRRCDWGTTNELLIEYHDQEWGVPLHDDGKLFEFLVLEGFQAGLSWLTILKKREAFRKAFDNFDPVIVSAYTQEKVDQLMHDSAIIRNRQKIEACINNARSFLTIQDESGSFNNYIWQFTGNKPIINSFTSVKDLPARTELSDLISADLKRRGFKFVGSTIVYAHMQATGMVNDHLVYCWRYEEIKRMG